MKLFKQTAMLGGIIMISSFLFTACSNESETKSTPENEEHKSPVQNENDKVYVLPTPLQVSFLINQAGLVMDDTTMVKPGDVSMIIGKESKALNLGAYLVDAGYSYLVGSKHQFDKYLDVMHELARELALEKIISEEYIVRLQQNEDNVDSVSYLLLSAYDEMHYHFKKLEREDDALIIISGAYLEGFYLLMKAIEKNMKEPSLHQFLVQQLEYNRSLLSILNTMNVNNNKYLADLFQLLEDIEELKLDINHLSEGKMFTQDEIDLIKNQVYKCHNENIIGG